MELGSDRQLRLQSSALFLVGLLCAGMCNGVQAAASGDLGQELINAARDGKLAEVKQLVPQGADINAADGNGETPLHAATGAGKLDVVQWLVGQGADINATNGDGETPLWTAALEGKCDAVQVLAELPDGGQRDRDVDAGVVGLDQDAQVAALFAHDDVFVARNHLDQHKVGLRRQPVQRLLGRRQVVLEGVERLLGKVLHGQRTDGHPGRHGQRDVGDGRRHGHVDLAVPALLHRDRNRAGVVDGSHRSADRQADQQNRAQRDAQHQAHAGGHH